jgi:hypothetical protein
MVILGEKRDFGESCGRIVGELKSHSHRKNSVSGSLNSRGDLTRTDDPLHPMQVKFLIPKWQIALQKRKRMCILLTSHIHQLLCFEVGFS